MTPRKKYYGPLVSTPKKRLAVYAMTNFACANCGFQFTPPDGYDGRTVLCDWNYVNARGKPSVRALECDHIIPRRYGGTNDLSNLQPLCTPCNARKGHRLPERMIPWPPAE